MGTIMVAAVPRIPYSIVMSEGSLVQETKTPLTWLRFFICRECALGNTQGGQETLLRR